jgi:hypothetical protein
MDNRHAEQVAEVPQAPFGPRREKLDAAEMGNVV